MTTPNHDTPHLRPSPKASLRLQVLLPNGILSEELTQYALLRLYGGNGTISHTC